MEMTVNVALVVEETVVDSVGVVVVPVVVVSNTSQLFPAVFPGHIHKYVPSILGKQVPPFLQGFGLQTVTKTTSKFCK